MQFTIPLFAVVVTAVVACARPRSPEPSPQDDAESTVTLAAVEGDFPWPRFLGERFDGKGVTGELEFDFRARPTTLWQLSVGSGYGLGAVDANRYYQLDAISMGGEVVERLRCVDLTDASDVWTVTRPMAYRDLYGYESGPRTTPTIAGQSIVTYGVDGLLTARDLADGGTLWTVDTVKEFGVIQNFFGVGSSPLIHEDMVIVAVGGSPPEDQAIAPGRLDRVTFNGSALVAFDLKTGKERWRSGDDLASYSSPRMMNLGGRDVVLLFARDHLLAVDPAAGEVLWKYRHRAEILESVNAMMPVVDADRVFISECYQVGSVLLKAGIEGVTEVWKDPENRRQQVMRCHWSTPILIEGYLYGCSGRNNPDSSFRCIDFKTGDLQWSDDRGIRTSLVQADDHLIVLDERGRMQFVRPSPDRLDVVAEHDFSDRLVSPCWAAPILVGNRLIARGDDQVVCFTLAKQSD